MNHRPLSRARKAWLAGAVALGVLFGASACGGPEGSGGPAASRTPRELTAFEERQVELVDTALRNPDPEGTFADEERVGLAVAARRQGTLRRAYDTEVKPGQSVKVDAACTGGGAVTLAIDTGDRTETVRTRCPGDGYWPQPFVFTVQDPRVRITATAHGTKGAMGIAVQGLREEAAVVRDFLAADRAHAVLPDDGGEEGEGDDGFIASARGSLRAGIPGSEVTVTEGKPVTVYAACVGSGSIRLSAAAGRKKADTRIACGRKAASGSVRLTPSGSTAVVTLARDGNATGGATYTVRSPW
ncbi:hypothetical protein [Streptomyces sp. NPDC047108]|uniref:hypothetical protein n=1 Tax=Streptomyces sp. NPDC047108 TaxID=3155025 RepID=UPI0033ED531C